MEAFLDHIVLNIVHESEMIHFYTKILDLEPVRLKEFEEKTIKFPSVRLNPHTIIDLFPKAIWGDDYEDKERGEINVNHFCLSLEKEALEQLQERLKAHQVPIDDGPAERFGAQGTGMSIYFRDPDGNILEARYYAESYP